MSLEFFPGQRVVCVNARNIAPPAKPLREGAFYTLREVDEWRGELGVRLEEIILPDAWFLGWKEYGYFAWRFRPVRFRGEDLLASIAKGAPIQPADPRVKIKEPSCPSQR